MSASHPPLGRRGSRRRLKQLSMRKGWTRGMSILIAFVMAMVCGVLYVLLRF